MNISGYLVSVVFASALGIVSDLMVASYGKSGKKIEKHVKLAVTLCILACILMPVIKNTDYNEIFDFEAFTVDGASEVKKQDSLYLLRIECEEKVSEYIFTETGITIFQKHVRSLLIITQKNKYNFIKFTISVLP